MLDLYFFKLAWGFSKAFGDPKDRFCMIYYGIFIGPVFIGIGYLSQFTNLISRKFSFNSSPL